MEPSIFTDFALLLGIIVACARVGHYAVLIAVKVFEE